MKVLQKVRRLLKKELKLNVPKDKEIDGNLWTTQRKQLLENTTASTKWAMSNFVAWRDG